MPTRAAAVVRRGVPVSGVQLLANQSVLFLDEPTTGLDATSAFQLVQTLKNLARKGRAIIMTSKWGLACVKTTG